MKKKNYKWIALSCTTIGALFSVLSASTLIALPVIMKDLNAGIGIITWTIMGYMLSLTIFVPSIGRIADMFGRKKLYVSGFAVFTVASLFCAMSESGIQLLVFRMIQSIGASLMIANSTVIITDVFPKSQLGKALGINAMVVSVAAVIGPILGGILINFSWRSIFYINIPITAGILLCLFAAAMMAVSPISGVLCDRYGARILSSIGLLISAVGLLGFMEIKTSSSMFYLVVCMIFTGIGSGMFFSPNTSSIMANVPEDKRGIATGVRVMFMNAGMVLSIAISMAIISSSISPSVMQALFVHSHVSSNGIASIQFMSGLRTAFTISFIFSLIAAFISYLRGPAPKWEEQGQT